MAVAILLSASAKGCASEKERRYVQGEVIVKFRKDVTPKQRELFHAESYAEVLSTLKALGVDRVRSKRGESTDVVPHLRFGQVE
jgi:hypothetical protein